MLFGDYLDCDWPVWDSDIVGLLEESIDEACRMMRKLRNLLVYFGKVLREFSIERVMLLQRSKKEAIPNNGKLWVKRHKGRYTSGFL